MSPAINRTLNPKIRHSRATAAEEQTSRLDMAVIVTSVEVTVSALKEAGQLAENLGARIRLLIPQVVPYPLPLTSPPVLFEFQEKRFSEIAAQIPVEVRAQIYLCRDRWQALKQILEPHSLIVIGCPRRWWPTRETILARKLRRAGHEVLLVEAVLR